MPAGPCEHGHSFRKSVRDFSFSFLSSFSLKRPFSGDLSHSGFWLPCRSTLSGLRKTKNGASLAMYLWSVLLSYVPFRRFWGFWRILAVLGGFGLDSCLLGPSGLEYGLLGWIWGFPSWNLAFGGLLRLNLNYCCFLGLFVFCCTVVAYLPTNLCTLSARLLINTVSSHVRRRIFHKEIPQDKSQRQTNK